ncbi:MAG: methionyl-tRNA formyltransferase [Alphaproteobacteria bacterium]|nr:methionyl-tRNA formyltransferase [Alphaproteobacteria bacterium]
MGTPEFSVPTLSELIGAGHEIVAVYSQPPRPAGRGMTERPSPVHAFAVEQGLDVRHPVGLKADDEQAAFAALDADAAVVVAYGLLLPTAILNAPREGCFNGHASALPRWRGAAPIQRAIMAGDTETAVNIMRMEQGLDTGPVCLAESVPIDPNMTAGELHDRLAQAGAGLMVRAIAALQRGSLECRPQPSEGVTYAAKIDKSESRIDFNRPASEVHNMIRGLSPFPGAWFEIEQASKPERVKALRSRLSDRTGSPGQVIEAGETLIVACGEGSGAIELTSLQRAGKKACGAAEFLRGARFDVATCLLSG